MKNKKILISVLVMTVAIASASLFALKTKAEQSGSTPESGVTSRIKATYDSIVALGHGSVAAAGWGDWGAMWNRIRSAAEWVPADSAAVTDVKSGITFHNTSRTQQTGTYPDPTSCSTQVSDDVSSYLPGSESSNCSITWITASAAGDGSVTGDDARAGRGGHDPRTGLNWSQLLLNSSSTVVFSASTNSGWSWSATDADNIAVGNKTASELCSDRGDGWRLPNQKELMQAYIDGSFWNLSQPAYNFWSASEYSATHSWYVNLSSGNAPASGKGTGTTVRCVR